MDTLKFIENLFFESRNENGPDVDVSEKVLWRLRSVRELRVAPFTLFAAASAVAASLVLFFAIHSWNYMNNPIMEFFVPVQEGWLW
jgi:hypothetical protein